MTPSKPLAALLLLALAACGREAEAPQAEVAVPTPAPVEARTAPGGALVLQAAMTGVVKPQTEVVLNMLIAALTEPPDIHVDPAKLGDSEWAIMETAATALRDEAVLLRDRPIQVIANPGDRLFGELELGTNGAGRVQAWIDAHPEAFSERAEELRVTADQWLASIQARDAVAAWRVALDLDAVCVECHEIFWSGELDHLAQGAH